MTQIEQLLSFFRATLETNDDVEYLAPRKDHVFSYKNAVATGIGVLNDGSGYLVFDKEFGARHVQESQLVKCSTIDRTDRVF